MPEELILEWVIDSEGVTVCSDCWDDEMRSEWPRIEAADGVVCETCERHVGEMPDWLTIRTLGDALKFIADGTWTASGDSLGATYAELQACRIARAALAAQPEPPAAPESALRKAIRAFERYASHDPNCPAMSHHECSCGFAREERALRAALDTPPAEPTENTVEAARALVMRKARYTDHDGGPPSQGMQVPVMGKFRDILDSYEAAVRADERSKATPAVPSEAVVERAAKAIWRAHHKEAQVPESWNAENWKRLARVALAALSEEAIDA